MLYIIKFILIKSLIKIWYCAKVDATTVNNHWYSAAITVATQYHQLPYVERGGLPPYWFTAISMYENMCYIFLYYIGKSKSEIKYVSNSLSRQNKYQFQTSL